MSQSAATIGSHPHANRTNVDADPDIQEVLGALTDEDCRAILGAICEHDQRLSATELSDACNVPLSTTYRKLEKLADARLLEERLRVRRSGHHETEYDLHVDGVQIAVDSDTGLEMHVSRRANSGELGQLRALAGGDTDVC